jgi:hypothetical protein
MAYSSETGGYSFAPVLAKIDEQSLAGLKPLSFAGGGQSPVRFQPLAGWSVPSSRPELIGQGIASGIGSIAQGVIAAYKSKKDREEKQKDREYELQKYQMQRENKIQDEETIARFKASLPSRARGGSGGGSRGAGIAPDYDNEDDAGDYGVPSDQAVMSSVAEPVPAPKAERYNRDFSPIKGGSFESINLPEEDEITEDIFNLKNGSSPLGSITAPVDPSAAPSPRGEDALRALSTIDWSKVQGSLGASTGAGAIPTDIPAQAPDWLRRPKAVTAPLATLGGFSDQALSNVDKALADAQMAYASGTEQPAVAPKTTSGVPKAAFKSYSEAQRYIDSQSANPNWYAQGAPKPDKFGNFIIPWKQHDPAAQAAREEAQKSREETQKTREEQQRTREDISKTRQELLKQNILNRETAMFQSHPAIKAFTGQSGMQQSLPRFVKDYDAILKNPESAGISDIGLLDMFARAEGGGRVTEGQARLALGSMGLKDKAMQLGYKLEGGDRLSQNQRDQMLRVIAEDHAAQVNLANQAIVMTRNKLKAQGVTDETSLPQPYIKAQTKWEGIEEIAAMKSHAVEIHQKQKQAEAMGDKQTADDLKRQLEEIGKSATELRRKIDKSKSAIINLDEIENTPQGWGGGAGSVIFQQP